MRTLERIAMVAFVVIVLGVYGLCLLRAHQAGKLTPAFRAYAAEPEDDGHCRRCSCCEEHCPKDGRR